MLRPRVSVIIPAFNSEEYVAEAIESVLTQNIDDLECIVVNDGSTDGTADVLSRYGNRIVVINQANKGVSAARNAGISASNGEWLAFLDSDDVWLPQKLKTQLAELQLNENIKIHSTNLSLERDHLQCEDYFKMINMPQLAGGFAVIDNPSAWLLKYHFAWLQSTIIHKSLLEQSLVEFNTQISLYEDFQWLLKLALRSKWIISETILVSIKRRNSSGEPLSRFGVKNELKASVLMLDVLLDHKRDLEKSNYPKQQINIELEKQYSCVGNLYLKNNKTNSAKDIYWSGMVEVGSIKLFIKYLLAALANLRRSVFSITIK